MQKEVFKKLFEGYLQNTLSQKETEQLMDVIKNDNYDDLIKEKIYSSLKENKITDTIDIQKGDYILNYILSKSTPTAKVIPFKPKYKRRKIISGFVLVAATVAILLAINPILFHTQKNHTPLVSAIKQKKVKINPMITFTGKQVVHLPDGSTVVLNDNSGLSYNQDVFNKKRREVTLTGEAYFDIKRNETKPFIVHTGRIQTKVLGTAFNINAYNTSDEIEVTVTRGKVQVGDTKLIYGVITPNQQIKVNKNTLNYEQNTVNAAIAIEWKSKYLILDNINMEEAIAIITEKYKVSILLSNEKIKNCRITASFLNDEDLNHILKVVCSVIETEYHYNKNGVIVLEGKGCE